MGKIDLFARIRLQSNSFTEAQKKIVAYLQSNSKEVMFVPINELAARCGVGEATIIRFYRSLGYESYQMFRVALAQEVAGTDVTSIYEEIQPCDSLSTIVSKVIQSSIQGIADLEKQLSLPALDEICDKLSTASHINIIGVGASGMVAKDAGHKLMRLGIKVTVYTDTHLMSIAAAVVKDGEVFLAFSHSGETDDIISTLQQAKQRGAYVCAVTSYMHSTITRITDAYLLSCTHETKFRSDAMISRIVQLVIIDILYVRLALKLGQAAVDAVNNARIAVTTHKHVSA